MTTIKSKSDTRLIVDVTFNGKQIPMLVDTGATVALVSDRLHGLHIDKKRKRVNSQGAGGELDGRICSDWFYLCGKPMAQFVRADISNIQENIRRETGIKIEGIIGLTQMRMTCMEIDVMANEIKI